MGKSKSPSKPNPPSSENEVQDGQYSHNPFDREGISSNTVSIGSSQKSNSPRTPSTFETDLSSPLRNRNEDRSGVAYKNDPKYQKYVQLVERNLQSFDYVSEWADVTAFLTKLSKAFEIYSRFSVVPHKEIVAKRLAQCLNPALPTGVHQKALGLYAQIFKQIGRNQLVIDLPLYSYGLFPFMRNASMKTKPQLLEIFEEYFIPLGSSLRACMKSFIMGLLPGLEEGSKDVFTRVMTLLDKLRDTIDPTFFFPTMFLVMITNTEQRESSLKYLSQRLPVFKEKSDLDSIVGEDPSLIVRALVSALSDSKTLVLRAALDLIMTRFPLSTNVLQDKDLVLLMKHASEVVLKKDMSLNRRLYTWLLGPGDLEPEQEEYFCKYSEPYITKALLGSFAALGSEFDKQHTVFRVLIGLLDKPSISHPILDTLFMPIMQLLIIKRDNSPGNTLPPKLASVSRMFMEMLDPIFPWSQVITQLLDTIDREDKKEIDMDSVIQALNLIVFFVQIFELDDDSTLQVHMPMATITIFSALERALRTPLVRTNTQIICYFTRTIIDIFTRIPNSVFADDGNDTKPTPQTSIKDLFGIACRFYRIHKSSLSTKADSAQKEEMIAQVPSVDQSAASIVKGSGLLHAIIQLCKSSLAHIGLEIIQETHRPTVHIHTKPSTTRMVVAMEDVCHILKTATSYARSLLNKPELASCSEPLPVIELRDDGSLKSTECLDNIEAWVPVLMASVSRSSQFRILDVSLSTLLDFVEQKSLAAHVLSEPTNLHTFVEKLWSSLRPEDMPNHYRSTQLIHRLRDQVDSRGVERHLASKLSSTSTAHSTFANNTAIQYSNTYHRELTRYSAFWKNTRLLQTEYISTNKQYDPLAFLRLLLLVLDNISPNGASGCGFSGIDASPSSVLSRQVSSKAWVDSSLSDWEYIIEKLIILLLGSLGGQKTTQTLVLTTGCTSKRQEYTAPLDTGRVDYYIETIHRYLSCAGDTVISSMLSTAPTNPVLIETLKSAGVEGETWLQVLATSIFDLALTDAPSDTRLQATKEVTLTTCTKASHLLCFLFSRANSIWPRQFVYNMQSSTIDSLLYSVLHRQTSAQPPLLDLFLSLANAKVTGPGETPSQTSQTTPAGLDGIRDDQRFARVVFAALVLQMDVAILRKWIGTVVSCRMFIQQQVSNETSQDDSNGLVGTLIIPCVFALGMLLLQCSEYFGKANGLHTHKHKQAKSRLLKYTLPLFVFPQDMNNPVDEAADEISVDFLIVLIDALDFFLGLSLKNASKIPVVSAQQRSSSRASNASSESSSSSVLSSTLDSIPILKLVSGIFFSDEDEPTTIEPPNDISAEADPSSQKPISVDSQNKLDHDHFSLVAIFSIIREIWDSFDFNNTSQLDTQSDGLTPSSEIKSVSDTLALHLSFGDLSTNCDYVYTSAVHMQRIVHTRISQVLEAAIYEQQTEVIESFVALWLQDNPSWVSNFSIGDQDNISKANRRRNSSVSTLQSPLSPVPSSKGSNVFPLTSVSGNAEAPRWCWRSIDLLESVSGCTPVHITTTLLTSLHTASIATSTSNNAAGPGGTTNRPRMHFTSLDEIPLSRFIELYSRHKISARLGGLLVHHIQSLLKEYNANAQSYKLIMFFLLRMFTVLNEKVARGSQGSTSMHNRGYSRDLFESYARVVENCILVAGRSFDQSNWLRRTSSSTDGTNYTNGLLIRTEATPDAQDSQDSGYLMTENELIEQTLVFISECVVPQLHLLVPDYERQVSIVTALMHYVITPALKSHMTGGYSGPVQALTSRTMYFSYILNCINALSLQPSLMKVWKREVWDFFCDPKFFPSSQPSATVTISPGLSSSWRHLIQTLVSSEKEKFSELLSRVTSASSAPALFANREHEAHMRALALRRLGFVIWSGTINQYLPSLPLIQEKLVDILKNNPHPAVQIEILLCLRVLLCRISNQHMSNFWPMLLTELMRLCLLQLNREGNEESEQANLFLSACKFLDLLFILGTDDFLVHQWIFITDTIDALYGSRSASYALLDQLSTRLLSLPSRHGRRNTNMYQDDLNKETYPEILLTNSEDPTNLVFNQSASQNYSIASTMGLDKTDLQNLGSKPLKRPIIRIRSVSSIRELDAFVHNASVQTYQAAYTMAEPDFDFIEALLESDLLYFDFSGSSTSTSAPMQAIHTGSFDM